MSDITVVFLRVAIFLAWAGCACYAYDVITGKIGRFTLWRELTKIQLAYVGAMFSGIALLLLTLIVGALLK